MLPHKNLLALLAFGLICLYGPFPAMAAPKLVDYSARSQEGKPARIIWQLTGVGRLSSDMMSGTNGLLYLPVGSKLVAVDTGGRVVWEAPGPAGGNMGRPVFGPAGSLFLPGASAVQEIKVNGAAGWSFSIYQNSRGSGPAPLCAGPGGLLYLPLPTALYAVDGQGRYMWALLHWDTDDLFRSIPVKDRVMVDCTGDNRAIYAVFGRRQGGYALVAVDNDGHILWRYWLANAKEVHLVVKEGTLYATVNPSRMDRLNRGKVYAFRPEDNGQPAWSYSLNFDDLTGPVLSMDNTLYFSAGKRIYALNGHTGTELWSQQLLDLNSPPAVDSNKKLIFAGTSDKRLLAINDQGRLIWDLELDGAISRAPLVGPDGYLYVVTDRGSLYKIEG
ncbi:MAG TPA: PQQ-binding-like beta-propeller repeat protein [Desulfotomaculum sp.]|nr:PQQ-binding-like beta-propeller repeat protein [Desulfotomaculum sp.]